ncbi:hypothetical protein ABZZ37_33365 [Streptomyces sp. NPDC006464]|uniref:hypothetical protein n=1 Tax=unclassified Streptomyces TaxID=2593676 RepID=UPI0033AD9529
MPLDPFAVLSALVRAEAARTAGSRSTTRATRSGAASERDEPGRRDRAAAAPAPGGDENAAR